MITLFLSKEKNKFCRNHLTIIRDAIASSYVITSHVVLICILVLSYVGVCNILNIFGNDSCCNKIELIICRMFVVSNVMISEFIIYVVFKARLCFK